jgi:hypothetical protein
VFGAVTAMVAAAITFGGGKQAAVFAANSSAAPLMGVSVSSEAVLKQDTAEFGRLGIYRVYYTGLPKANAWTTGLPAANHSAVIVSFKALPSAILSGADDAVLRHFFDTAPTGHTIYYTYYHEPEDNIHAGQFTAAAYRAAWTHVVALARAAHNPFLHSTLTLMAYDLRPASHRNWRDYMPPGGIISTLAWDAYPPGARQLMPPAQFMAPEIATSKAAGIPFGFAEFGVTNLNGRPSWLSDVGNYLMKSGALFGTLFNSTPPGAPPLILHDQPSISAWRNIVSKSNSMNGIGGPDPGPSPAPPTPAPTPPPAINSPGVSGLALSPAVMTAAGRNHTAISFRVNQAADVTVLVLDGKGAVVRTLARPTQGAGRLTLRYFGYNGAGHRIPAGTYHVLVVASNAHGSGTAESSLTIAGP